MKAIGAAVLMFVGGSTSAEDRREPLSFTRDIRPLLSDNCFHCHGPDAGHRQADLRLDVRDEAVAAKAIVPGKAAESSLVERIRATDPDVVMPPPESHKKLDARQQDLIARWIDEGATYQKHWAYEPPVKPQVPAGTNAIDQLVGARLKTLGLKSAAEADRRALSRRLSFDLTGLPPTPQEVDAFVNDPSPDAYARLVERLLASPHYGERMAIGWLDVVRFADTVGYHSDNPRNVWPYRDYVIKSFNDNKPFDRFTIEQIAGDLLPEANQDTRIASCFNRLLLTTEEGGAQPKDYEARMLTDRVRAVGAVWLGQTTGCAGCHDHKFDPITMRDFYSLAAFFADVEERTIGKREDGMVIAPPEDVKKLADLDASLVAAKQKRDSILPQLDAAQKQWEHDVTAYGITLPELKPDSKATDADKKTAELVADALGKELAKQSGGERGEIQKYFRTKASPHLFRAEQDAVTNAERDRTAFYNTLTKCLVTVRRPAPAIVRILPRGNWMDESGEVMKPAFPGYLPAPAIDGREPNRLDLAQWLVSRDHPLTARVVMNRLWKQFFGTGLSRVLDDLGAQGEPPVNPELLDWLACEFMDSKWDLKHMVRTIVSSAAYRQSSVAAAETIAADPMNRELARQTAWRVDAELVRDAALATSGLLVRTIGGPSVKPYQPDGYWENLNFPPRVYPTDTGEKQYRRGLYTWWQRSFLHPSMLAFDAPSREECCAERTRSNIPQQALALLNDPSYVEASRAFAAWIMKDGGKSPEERSAWAWRQVLQRVPRIEEMETVVPLYRQQLAAYQADPAAAAALVKVGFAPAPTGVDSAELAAWTHVARVLFNLHETITRP
ncbi:MAG: PSD1 and planctomycete cytochrome C domain-containing protein [Planctomycetia bacterium]|nr:PSD1 and planctomycete cytochrome C domain-containing protein [Planctomycetia bacterium]